MNALPFRFLSRKILFGFGLTVVFVVQAPALIAEEITVTGGRIDLQFTEAPPEALRIVAKEWADRAAQAVALYYGAFPVKTAGLLISWREGSEPAHGQAFGQNGPHVTIDLGRAATAADLSDDWMLTHELLHLGFPSLRRNHHWLEEGLATYVEPVARARAGQLTDERFWADLVHGLPQGEPAAGDRGLDQTHTWGRTYWGGALFCLRVDLEIRRRTGNQRGLEDALRAIVAAGGTIEHDWDMDRVIKVGDGATGVPVLEEIYGEMKETPLTVDLLALWKELGVVRRGQTVEFDDTALLASIRQTITRPRKYAEVGSGLGR